MDLLSQQGRIRRDFFNVQFPELHNGQMPKGKKRNFAATYANHKTPLALQSHRQNLRLHQQENQRYQSNSQFNVPHNQLSNEPIQNLQLKEQENNYQLSSQAKENHSESKKQEQVDTLSKSKDQDNQTINEVDNQDAEQQKYRDQETQANIPTIQSKNQPQNQPVIDIKNDNFYFGLMEKKDLPCQITPPNLRNRRYNFPSPNIEMLRRSYVPMTQEELKMQRKIDRLFDLQKVKNDFLANEIRNKNLKELEFQIKLSQDQQKLEQSLNLRKIRQQQKYREQLDLQQKARYRLYSGRDYPYENSQFISIEDNSQQLLENPFLPEICSKIKQKRTIFNPLTFSETVYNENLYSGIKRALGNVLEKDRKTLPEINESQFLKKSDFEYQREIQNMQEQQIQNQDLDQDDSYEYNQTYNNHYLQNKLTKRQTPHEGPQYKIQENDEPIIPQAMRFYRGNHYPDTKQLIG